MAHGNSSNTLVIVAALNEEEGIGPTLAELQEYLGNPYCLVVDGNSTDKTVKVAEAMGAKVIAQKDEGKGNAIAIAIQQCHSLNLKYAAIIDADFTYPAFYLPSMVAQLEAIPSLGMVCGDRFGVKSDAGAMRRMFDLGNRLLASTHRFMNNVDLHDPLTGLRVVRWELLRDWKPRSKGFDIEIELNCHVDRMGYKIVEMPIRYRARLGTKKLKMRHGFTILRRIFDESFAYFPEWKPNT
jgi:dolichol-phosphate mannosyltransferase